MTRAIQNSPTFIVTAILLLGFLIVAAIMGHSRYMTISQSVLKEATIVDCGYVNHKRARNRGGGYSSNYYPIAISDDGDRARGTMLLATRSMCERLVGSLVSVYVHNSDSKNNRINSFYQMWLLPLIALVYLVAIIGPKKRGYRPMICVLLIIFAALALCREFGVFNLKQANAKLTPEERKFQACVNQAMRSERVSERKEIKKLICYPTPDVGSLDEFESLEEVLIRNDDFDSMHEIPYLPNLKKLSIGGEKIKSIDGLDQFSNLTELAILSNMLSSIKEIPATLNLETLKIRSNPRLISLDGVEQFKSLKWFEVKRNSITDITAIASLTELEAIDLTALSNLNKLETCLLYTSPSPRDRG